MKVSVDEEKDRSKAREEEAFAARCDLVNLQEELTNTKEKVKLVEQERDALRTIAKNEEVLRIAAEGRIPLPSSPRKPSHPEPLSPERLVSSAASEDELEELKWKVRYERQRLERAFDLIDYMKTECQFNCCSCRIAGAPAGIHEELVAKDHSVEAEPRAEEEAHDEELPVVEERQDVEAEDETTTVFIPSEGVFRKVPSPIKKSPQLPLKRSIEEVSSSRPTSSATNLSFHARTPSFDPPAPAIQQQINTSLLSLINGEQSPRGTSYENAIEDDEDEENDENKQKDPESPSPHKQWQTISTTTRIPLKPDENTPIANKTLFSHGYYPVSKVDFGVTSNTQNLQPMHLRGGEQNPTTDSNAIIGTMTKEEALAQIKLRRGRAQSIAQGTLTPRKKMCEGVGSYERRDISAPAAVTMKGFGSAARTPKSAPHNRTGFGM